MKDSNNNFEYKLVRFSMIPFKILFYLFVILAAIKLYSDFMNVGI